MALTDNILAYWKMDESSGNPADSVNSYTLTNNGSVSFSSGKINNGANFGTSNSSKYFSYGSGILGADKTFSYSGWFKLTASIGGGSKYHIFVDSYTGGAPTTKRAIWYYYDGGDTRSLYFQVSNGYSNEHVYYAYKVNLSVGAWHHVALTYNQSTNVLTAYFDGSSVGSDNAARSGTGSVGSRLNMGAWTYSGDYANIMTDEVGIWTRVLTSTEVSSLYNGGSGLQYPFILSSIKSYNGLAYSSVKSVNGLAVASVKKINGLA